MDFNEFRDLVLSLPDHAARHGEAECLRLLGDALLKLARLRTHLKPEEDKHEMEEFRKLLLPSILESDFCGSVYRKPRGYPGDFETQEKIWLGRTLGGVYRYRGTSEVGKMLNALTLDMANCAANEERIRRLAIRVRESGPRVASIGCGSCIELWEQPDMRGYDFLLLDQDAGALESAKSKISSSIGRVTYIEQNILKFLLRGEKNEGIGNRHLVYAFGLFDYFEMPSANRLVKGLWAMVAPGGTLIVTNAHPANPTRLWMEWGGDWFLKYKDESQMPALLDGLECVANSRYSSDSRHVYQFLEIQKNH